jgi:hypothetical protein
MVAFWGTLFQVAVAPVQWDAEAQRLTIEEVAGPSAPKMQLKKLDRLVNWSNEFLGRRDNDRVYPAPIDRNVQAARGSSTTVDMNVDEENNKGGVALIETFCSTCLKGQ